MAVTEMSSDVKMNFHLESEKERKPRSSWRAMFEQNHIIFTLVT